MVRLTPLTFTCVTSEMSMTVTWKWHYECSLCYTDIEIVDILQSSEDTGSSDVFFFYTQVVGLSGGWAPKTQDFDVGHLCSCPGLHCSGGGWVLNSSLHQCCTLHGSVITVRHTILINTLFLTHNTNYLHSHFRFDTFSLTKYDTSLKTVDLYVIS